MKLNIIRSLRTKFSLALAAGALGSSLALGATSERNPELRPMVSEEVCPLTVIEAPTDDGHKATAVMRTPPGEGRLPAVIFLHGGLQSRPLDVLKRSVLSQPPLCRFLAAGYVTVSATFRPREQDPQTRDALTDCLAIVDYVKKLPRVDPRSVVLFGGSGGGSLALELAGETELCAVAAGEPANVLFTGVFSKENHNLEEVMADSRKYYTPELQRFTEDKIKRISCPVFIVHSDVHAINKINNEIVIPAMRVAGKPYEIMFIPGLPHGFYNGYGPLDVGLSLYEAMNCFYGRHLPTKPQPIPASLIKYERIVTREDRDRDPSAKAGAAKRGERTRAK